MMSDSYRNFDHKGNGNYDPPLSNQEEHNILVAAKGGGQTFIGTVITRGLKYGYFAILIWGLGAGNFGLFTLAFVIASFVGSVANLGLASGIVRYGAIHAQTEGKAGIHNATMAALRILLPSATLFLIVLLLTADIIANSIFGKPEIASIIRVLGLGVPFMSLQATFLAGTRAYKIMKYSVIVGVIQPLAALVFALFALILGLGMHGVTFSYVLSLILGSGLATHYYFLLIAGDKRITKRFPAWDMLKFSLPLSFNQWIHFINERTEIFFLGLLPNAIDIGIYNVAWRVATLETMFVESLNQIVAPLTSDLHHRKAIKQLESLYKTVAKWDFTFGFIVFLTLWAFSEKVMTLFDPAYAIGASVLIWLGFAQLVNAGTGPCGTVLIMSGRSDLSFMNTVILLVVSIGLDLLLIPKYGLQGAAWAGAIAVILVNLLRLSEVWLTLKIHPFKWGFTKPLAAGVLSLTFIKFLQAQVFSSGLLADLLCLALLVIVYFAIIYLLKLDTEDILVINAIRRKILSFKKA
jgi:O-antigen/teichoic acid export membrane protein